MVATADPPGKLNAKPCIVAGELRVWGDMRENGKYKFIWEFENCENGIARINIQPKGLTRKRTGAGLGCRRY